MRKTVTALITTYVVILSASAILIDSCYADTGHEIQVVQHGHGVVLSVSNPESIESVTWDLGDGRIVKGPSIQTSFKSGLWKVKAIVNSTDHLERWIGIYDASPPSYAERNGEYRYGVISNTAKELQVLDENGSEFSWLIYDSSQRAIVGIPDTTGLFHVWFGNEYWTITVIDTGITSTIQTSFTVQTESNRLKASPETSHDTTSRYSWSVRDLNDNLINYHEGRNLDIEIASGYYVVSLQLIKTNGSVNYSQLVFVDGDIGSETPDEERSYTLPLILGIITIVLLMVATMTYSPVIATSSVISAILTILTVIL